MTHTDDAAAKPSVDLTEAQRDKMFDVLREAAIKRFTETGTMEPPAAVFAPANAPDSLIVLGCAVPPPGEQRHALWDFLRLQAIVTDAVAFAFTTEFWTSPSGQIPARAGVRAAIVPRPRVLGLTDGSGRGGCLVSSRE